VLIVEEAHEPHHFTLAGLKRVIEMCRDGGAKLCVLLVGWPELTMICAIPASKEVENRAAVFSLGGVTSSQREYIEWSIGACVSENVTVHDVIDPAALDLLASRLRTPLQIGDHLTLALETGYQASETPVSEALSSPFCQSRLTNPKPTLAQHGYMPEDPSRIARRGADRGQGHVSSDARG
jgi:type II secretory pathway predicted ATPase ExeA